MPDETPTPTPEYDTYERLGGLSDECRAGLVMVQKEVDAACQEKEDLGKLAVDFMFDTCIKALYADGTDPGTEIARNIVADYAGFLTKDFAFPISIRVAELRVLKAERMRTITEQLDRIELVRTTGQEPSLELLAELEILGKSIQGYGSEVVRGFGAVEWCGNEFVRFVGMQYGDDLLKESNKKPESVVLTSLRQAYETGIEKIRTKKQEFTDSPEGIAMQDTLREVLKRIAEEEAELETYLRSKDMQKTS